MLSSLTNSTIEYEVNGTAHSLTVSHPAASEQRAATILRYLQVGCEMLVDLDHLPSWACKIPVEAQAAALNIKPELFQYYKLRVPGCVTFSDKDWPMLCHLAELRHLSISCAGVTPDDLANALHLEQLEILVLHSPAVSDSFCSSFPRLKQLRVIDVLGTPITKAGVRSLHEACPNARVYADGAA